MEKELPKNWVNPPFTFIFDINGGTQPPKSEFLNEPQEGYVRLLQIRDFGEKPVPTYIPDKPNLRKCQKSDILIARYGASIGRIVTDQEGAYNVALAKVKIPPQINKTYVRRILESHIFQDPILAIQRTAQNGFNKTDLANINIPLPPLPEQNRIVAKLDMLFGQLDTINESLEKIPVLLKSFRQQVLTQAVTGKLTEEWRKGKEVDKWIPKKKDYSFRDWKNSIPKNWEIYSFQTVADINANLRDPAGFLEYPLIAPNHIEKYTGRLIKIEYTKDIQPKSDKHWFEQNSIVYSKIRPYLSKLILADFSGLCSADMYPISTDLEIKYLYYYMLSDIFLNYASTAGERSVLPKINQKGLNQIPVPVPSKEEQLEIINRIESLFNRAEKIQEEYDLLKIKIEQLPQSILHKAFKGELVPQVESDGDARELLEEIKNLKNKT